MADETHDLGASPKTLEDLLAACIAAEESGRAIDRDALYRQHPEHAAELQEFLANRDQMRRLAEPLQGAAAVARANGHPLGKVRYFGDYELLEEIAAGGMGIVYKARQVSLNRVVAVKMILKGTLASEDDVKRFRAEAEAAASLQHPGIVAIHEVGLHEGQHYFSMDYVEGQSLAQLPRENPLSAKQAAEYVRDAAEAVHYAHQQGTLHRDLKPSNVLIDRQGRVRITDFGLAKRIEGNSDLTLTGQVLGTPSYMPPEQALGKRSLIGTASDVYSLGAVLYELLAGRPPFRGESVGETLRQVETLDPVGPRLLSPATPRDLETICLKCLEKEPHKRYLTAQHLAADLGRFLRHEPILARPISRRERGWRWCRRHPVVALLSASLLLLLMVTTAASAIGYYSTRRAWQSEVHWKQAEDVLRIMEAVELLDGHEPDFGGAEELFSEALARQPENAAIYFHRGRARWERGEARLAYDDAQRSLELQPAKNRAAALLLVESAIELGEADQARRACEQLEQDAAGSAEALAGRGLIDPLAADAFDLLTRAIDLQPRDARYVARRGWVAWQLTQCRTSKRWYDQTLADLQRALQLRPFDARARQQLLACGVRYHFLADAGSRPLERTKAMLDAWFVKSPDDPAAVALLIRWQLMENLFPDAVALSTGSRQVHLGHPELMALRGEALWRAGRDSEAVAVLTAAAESLPTERPAGAAPVSRVLLAAQRAQIAVQQGDPQRAEALLAEYQSRRSGEEWTYEEWMELTRAWRSLGDKQRTGAASSNARQIPPGIGHCRRLCAEWQALAPESPGPPQLLGNLDNNINHFEAALRLAPSVRWPLFYRGKLHAAKEGGHRMAKEDFEAFLKYFPAESRASFALVKLLIDSVDPDVHDLERGLAIARRLVERKSQWPECWDWIAHGEHLAGRDDLALSAVDSALAIEPEIESRVMLRSEILLALGRWKDARHGFDLLLQRNGRSPERLAAIATRLAIHEGGDTESYELALLLVEEARATFAKEQAAATRRAYETFRTRATGMALYRLGRSSDALAIAKKEEQEPFILVMALWRSGQHFEAWRLYQEQARLVAEDLAMLDRGKREWANLRREAARVIGAQFGDELIRQDLAARQVGPADYPQWGGWAGRNNVSLAPQGPNEWDIGTFDRKTGAWQREKSRNIKWVAPLGSQTYGNPAVAGGRIFLGTNNSYGYLKRYPDQVDVGCLIALSESDGRFLWQHCSEKLPTGRQHDWPLMGICSAPLVEGERLWFVTSRGEVRCLDVDGMHDGIDDGRLESLEPARLFDIVRADDPAQDKVNGYVAQLDAGKLPADLREKFASAGMPLPESRIDITTDDKATPPKRRWTFQAKVGEAIRDFVITLTGPRLSFFKLITPADKEEADVLWVYDMMRELGISQHNMCTCAPTAWGDTLFINTSNGVDDSHMTIPAPQAPSFIALDKHTGQILWTDNSPGANIHHGQWSAPAVGVFAGVPQVIFGAGDGWVYSFHAEEWENAKPKLLWKFDTNPKDAVLELGGRGTRDEPIAVPVIYDGYVYVTAGQDPEHGEGIGHLWCIDPTRRGDVSPQLAVHISDRNTVLPHRRIQAIDKTNGEMAIDNPNAAVVWHYSRLDANTDLKFAFEEEFHRSISSVVAKNDLLIAVDFSGLCHCLNAKTGRRYWTSDMLAAAWGTPLVVGQRVYVPDEDGDISIFELHPDPRRSTTPISPETHYPIKEINMGNSVYSTPLFANGVLYIANKDHLFAIVQPESIAPVAARTDSPTLP